MRAWTGTIAIAVCLALEPSGGTAVCAAEAEAARASDTFVYVGTDTEARSKGISLFRLQTQNLEVSQNITLVPLGLAAETPNPSSLELDIERRLLFAVNEVETFDGKATGAVAAFKVEPTGRLTLLNRRPSMGTRPCHLALDRGGRNLLVANCGSGSVSVLPVAADGRLGEPGAVVQHGPQVRCIVLDPANRFAFACDLGLDKILIYAFDAAAGTLAPHRPASVSLKPGAGPHRMVFRPDGRFAYVAGELGSTLTAFAYDAAAGVLSELQTVSTVPEHFDGPNAAAELGIHPTGRYLYVSNRGHNSVVLFRIDPERGTLTYVEEQGTGGSQPRHFGIEPSAKHLAIANRDSDTVLVARIDAGNGRLKPSGVFASVASPTDVKFLPPAGDRPAGAAAAAATAGETPPRSQSDGDPRGTPGVPSQPPPGDRPPEVVLLWPAGAPGSEGKTVPEAEEPAREDGIRRISSIHRPSLTVHLPPRDAATGAAVIIMPGGGHRYLSIDNEGHAIARWLAERGIAGLVLKYRLAREAGSTYSVEEHAAADARRAMRVARSRARDWGLDPGRIGVLGLSAGGQLAFHAAARFDAGNPEAQDPVEREGSRPAFQALLYSGPALAGAAVPRDAPPAFLCVAFDDQGPARTALDLYQRLRDAGGSVELHVYAKGGHGFGMKDRPLPITGWVARFREWLAGQGILEKGGPSS